MHLAHESETDDENTFFVHEIRLVHFHGNGTNSRAQVMEVDIGMGPEQRYWNGRIPESLGNHQCRESNAERVVMVSWMPD